MCDQRANNGSAKPPESIVGAIWRNSIWFNQVFRFRKQRILRDLCDNPFTLTLPICDESAGSVQSGGLRARKASSAFPAFHEKRRWLNPTKLHRRVLISPERRNAVVQILQQSVRPLMGTLTENLRPETTNRKFNHR